jgi:FkbM family methyltransferase
MSVATNPHFVTLRRLTRKVGLNRMLGRFLGTRGYEAKLASTMSAAVSEGDCVWDVGANIGHYTSIFADLVGGAGRVLAFEPSPENAARLRDAMAGRANVTIFTMGLSNTSETALLVQGEDDLGATSHLSTSSADNEQKTYTIELHSGDYLLESPDIPAPNVLKIDVEGHEIEVLEGLGRALNDPGLRHIFVEVHFGLLEKRGRMDGPSMIEAMLLSQNYRVHWIDPSHLHAFRTADLPS